MATKIRLKNFGFLSTLFIAFNLMISSQAYGQSAIGQCAGVVDEDHFTIFVDGSGTTGSYNIFIDGVLQLSNITGGNSFTSDEIAFVDGTTSYVVTLKNTGNPNDSMVYVVHEVLCTDIDDDGTMDFNTADCDYTKELGTGGAIVSTVAPFNSDHVYLYVLTDSSGEYSATPTTNYSGYFEGLSDGEYRVSAYHFLDTIEAQGFVTGLTTHTNIDSFSSMSAPVCYNFCGGENYTVECECIVSIDSHPDDETTCADQSAEFYVVTSLTEDVANAELTYHWEESTNNGSSFDTLTMEKDSILTFDAVAASDSGYQYRVVVTLEVNSVVICRDTSTAGILHVDPLPELATDLTATVCSDEASGITLAVASGSVEATDYNIVSIDSSTLTSSAGSPSTGVTSDASAISDDAWTNTTGAQVTVTYKVAPQSGDGCVGDTVDVTVLVDPAPVYSGPIEETVCSNDEIGIMLPSSDSFSNSIDSFVVSASVGSNLTGTPTQGGTGDYDFLSLDTFENVSGLVDTVTYTVTPFSGDCSGEDFTIYAIVNPEPVFASAMTASVCSDVAIGENIPFSDDNSLGIDSVDIVVIIGDSLSGTSAVGAGVTGITSTTFIAADEFTNTTSVVDSVVYTITPYAETCVGEPYDIVVYITPEPVGSDPALMVCSDEDFTIDLSSLITNGASVDSFTWIATSNDSITGESTTLQETGTITQTLTNITAGVDSIVYTVTPQSTSGGSGCLGEAFTVTVFVNPEPVGTDEVVTVCSEEALDIVLTDNITKGLTVKGFIYTVDNPSGTARTDTSAGSITDVFTNTTGSDITVIYTVIPFSNENCQGDAFTVTVTVESEPVLATDLDGTVCSGSSIGVVLDVDTGSVGADSFNIVSITQTGLTADTSNVSTGIYASVNTISGDSYTNGGSSSINVTYAIAPISASGCVGDTVDVVVTIDPEAVVDAGSDETICSNGEVVLSSKGSISGGATTGTWSAPGGDGTFTNSTYLNGAAAYIPGEDDIAAGTVTLVLTSATPEDSCPAESDSVVITINDVECSTFPWNGN